MNVINNLLISMSPEALHVMYYIFHALGFVAAAAYIIIHGKRYHITPDQRFMLLLVVVIMGISVEVLYILYKSMLHVEFRNLAQTLLLLGPLVWYGSKLTGTPVHANLDIMAPMFMTAKGVSGLGCLFWGCCGGAEVPWGIYSYQREALIVPVQALEFVLTAALVLWSLWYEKRHHYGGEGKAFGWTVTMYGAVRFFTDTLREKNRLFWRTSVEGVFALSFILIGVVALIVCYKKREDKS